MKIFSWNVNGIRAVIKKGEFKNFIKFYQPDIICLQETKAKQGQAEIDLPDYEEFWNDADRPGYSGTAIFSKIKPLTVRYGFTDEINNKYDFAADRHGDPTHEGRVLTAEFDNFYLITVYTPNAKPELTRLELRAAKWDPAMLEYIQFLEETKPVVMCGDMNVAHQEIDLARPKDNVGNAGFTEEERQGMTNFLNSGLVDTFRHLHPSETGAYTWWTWRAQARARNIGWRIDYFLVSKALAEKITAADIYPEQNGSDHCPISVTLPL
jgi:exodeoxyribonuclease-3